MKKFFMSMMFCFYVLIPLVSYGDNQDLGKRIDLLEKEVSNINRSISNFIASQKETTERNNLPKQAIEELTGEIKNLQSDIESLELKINKYSNKNNAFENAINSKIASLTKNINSSESGTKAKDNYLISNISKELEVDEQYVDLQHVKTNESQAAAEYQKAYSLLKNSSDAKKNEKALEAFMSFVDKFQDSPLRGNAYYWIGSIHTEQKNYNKAAIDFLNGYKANTKSGRAIDNLLGLSNSLIKLNKTKEACSALNKLYNEFPNMNMTNKRHTDDMFKNAGCSNDN